MSRKNKVDIPDDLKTKCNVIIHGASTASAAACAGIAQIPLADNAVLAPIQVAMIVSIAKVFDQNIGEGVARGLLSTFAATFVGRGVTQVLFGWVPFMGNALNSATAAALTEAIGWMAADHFAKGYKLDQSEYEDDPENPEQPDKRKTQEPEIQKPATRRKQKTKQENPSDTEEVAIVWSEDFEKRARAALEKNDPAELDELVSEFEKKERELPENDPLRDLYDKLLEARC